jgi:hypothetical protein
MTLKNESYFLITLNVIIMNILDVYILKLEALMKRKAVDCDIIIVV